MTQFFLPVKNLGNHYVTQLQNLIANDTECGDNCSSVR